ncbi:hypothetical protein YB2330_001181 [Saitoella coloradoensis]
MSESFTASLQKKNAASLLIATRTNPFIASAINGSLTDDRFNRWMQQDVIFVEALGRYEGLLLHKAPLRDFQTVVSGIAALEAELRWFVEQAVPRGVKLVHTRPSHSGTYETVSAAAAAAPATQAYNDYILQTLPTKSYLAQITAVWAIELTYLQAWRNVLNESKEDKWRQNAEHWAVPEFQQYVAGLQKCVEDAFEESKEERSDHRAEVWEAEECFQEVLRLEEDFWKMAMEA